YQFDYVFDWTVLKYPQAGGTSRGRHGTGKAAMYAPTPGRQQPDKTPARHPERTPARYYPE
ncbi:casein kinase I isoform delta-like protein, partial [Trifolium medium]|nr:casein kinase I isoform delta-like protein [Trifolium medium]